MIRRGISLVPRVVCSPAVGLRRFASSAPAPTGGDKKAPKKGMFDFFQTDDLIPTNEQQAVGLERMQMEAAKKGKPVFASNIGLLKGPFGTSERPVLVPSVFSSRVVGCNGGDGDHSHDLLWHEVRKNETVVCMACGQHFKLQEVHNEHWSDGFDRPLPDNLKHLGEPKPISDVVRI